MYQATVNDKEPLHFDNSDFDWDLIAINEHTFHILHNNRSYEATVLEADFTTKSIQLQIGQNTYSVALKDKFDLLAEQLGFSNMSSQKLNHIKAPMPGLVLDIMVKAGDAVNKGDSVLILEAMKMENVIKAEGEAVVKSITINKGDAVEKNQIMIEFEEE
ncbi:MAG: acetyl-CoA carboxylase biotin carboxyl carrier protein subunit [Aureispira sp.]